MRKHEHAAASGLSHFGPSAGRTLHDAGNRRQNKYLLSQHGPRPSCSSKTNKHGLKLGCPAESTEEFQILLSFCMSSLVQSKRSILLGQRQYQGNWSSLKGAGILLQPRVICRRVQCLQSIILHVDGSYYGLISRAHALPDCRAGFLFPCPLKLKCYPGKPRSPVCSWHGGQKS